MTGLLLLALQCAGSWSPWIGVEVVTICTGEQIIQEVSEFIPDDPACPVFPWQESRFHKKPCDLPPMVEVPCHVVSVLAPYVDGDVRATVRCETDGRVPVQKFDALTIRKPEGR
jgi:hypothetical protein